MTELLIIAILAWLAALFALGSALLAYGAITAIRALMKG